MVLGIRNRIVYLDEMINNFENSNISTSVKEHAASILKSVEGSIVTINNLLQKYGVNEEAYKRVEKSVADSSSERIISLENAFGNKLISKEKHDELMKIFYEETPITLEMYARFNVSPLEEKEFSEERSRVREAMVASLEINPGGFSTFCLIHRTYNQIIFCGERIRRIIR